MSLATLPGELYTAIIQHLEPSSWTEVVLTLSRVLPSAPIPIQLLFHSIRIRRARQAVALLLRLRKAPCDPEESIDPCASWVKEFSVETWTVDADVLIDIVRLLPNLSSLNVRIGPSNISPEHLEHLFQEPIGMLMQLSIRFGPCLKRASYYQFHEGAYFDSTLFALAKWPPQKIPKISIVQDPPQEIRTERRTFAQPIVFFLLDPHLSVLIHSPSIAHSMTALRLRLPSRPVARPLCISLPEQKDVYYSPEASPVVPNLEFLDLSTCGVIEEELEMILARFRNLKHLIIDECLQAVIGLDEWGELGKRCALVGVHRAREREKELKARLEEGKAAEGQQALGSDGGPAQLIMNPGTGNEPRRQRLGRRGLATPTLSIRDHSSGIPRAPGSPKPPLSKIRILPFVPRLVTLAMTDPIGVQSCRHASMRSDFEAGWAEGMAQLEVTYARLRTSLRHGVRVLREDVESQSVGMNGMEGLEDVDADDDEAFTVTRDTPPILCLAGPRKNRFHVPNCGHLVGWNIWHETLAND